MQHSVHHHAPVDRSYTLFVGSLVFVGLLTVLLFSFYQVALTANAIADLQLDPPFSGRPLTGRLYYDLTSAPLPLESTITLSFNSYTRSLPLRTVLEDQSLASRARDIVYAPPVTVTMVFTETTESDPSTSPGSSGSGEGSDNQYASGDDPALSQENPNKGGNKGGGSDPTLAPWTGAGLEGTGLATSPITETKTYVLRAGEFVDDSIPARRTFSIQDVQVHGTSIGSSFVTLESSTVGFRLSTTYVERVRGFSSDSMPELTFLLAPYRLDIPARTKLATVRARFDYRGDVLAESEQSVAVHSSELEDSGIKTPQGGTTTGAPASCERPVCTLYGACTISSSNSFSRSTRSRLVQLRECTCEDGRTYTEEQACVRDFDSSVTTSSSSLGAQNTVPKEISTTGSVDAAGFKEWTKTYEFPDTYVSSRGGVTQTLARQENMLVPVAGSVHEVGVLQLDTSPAVPRALVQVKSTPQTFYLSLGETRAVDVTDDDRADMDVTFSAFIDGRALIRVYPYDVPTSSNEIGSGEHAITLIKQSTGLPVAHVIVNEKLQSLRVFLVQSSAQVAAHCSNTILDSDEMGIDCGGSCGTCRVEKPYYAFFGSWGVVVALSLILIVVVRTRRR